MRHYSVFLLLNRTKLYLWKKYQNDLFHGKRFCLDAQTNRDHFVIP